MKTYIQNHTETPITHTIDNSSSNPRTAKSASHRPPKSHSIDSSSSRKPDHRDNVSRPRVRKFGSRSAVFTLGRARRDFVLVASTAASYLYSYETCNESLSRGLNVYVSWGVFFFLEYRAVWESCSHRLEMAMMGVLVVF